MALIKLSNINLTIPIFDYNSQSIRRAFLKKTIGGDIVTTGTIAQIQALKNVNLKIGSGETVGLVGHNGAGKTSFLRLLSGIYAPSSGQLEIDGEVRAILSTSDGIEPSLSGLDNIYRIGLMRGMSFDEIKSYEEEIVDFSGLAEFIRLPVRTFSSGMQMRLIFSIITSGKSDILLLDEFVATGDADFMEKAKERLSTFISDAQILVFASHSKELLEQYCERILYFDKGFVTEKPEQGME